MYSKNTLPCIANDFFFPASPLIVEVAFASNSLYITEYPVNSLPAYSVVTFCARNSPYDNVRPVTS